jgi:hypothetical protein
LKEMEAVSAGSFEEPLEIRGFSWPCEYRFMSLVSSLDDDELRLCWTSA